MPGITREMLMRRQELPLEAKLTMTQARIRLWYEHYQGDVYISYSGGKDSTVLRHIVKEMYPDVPAVFCDTGLEYPEVREMGLKADVVIRPKKTFKQVIEECGYPFPSKEQAQYIREYRHTNSEKLRQRRWNGDEKGRYAIHKQWRVLCDAPFDVSEKCCDIMKKEPFRRYERETGRKGMVGTMACESNARIGQYLRHGCNAFDAKRPISTPLAFWMEHDILRYIKENDVEYASCYGNIIERGGFIWTDGLDRTGCMFCAFGVNQELPPNRFQRMRDSYPKQYDYCINKLGIGRVLDYCGIPY